MIIHRWFLAVAILVGLSGLFYPIHPDEAVFLGIGVELRENRLLYVELFDQKPPGIYLLAALLGGNILTYRVLIMFVNWLIAYGIFCFGGKSQSAWSISLVYLVINPWLQGQFFLTEIFVAALCLYSWIAHKKPIAMGLIMGTALWFKQTAWLLLLAQGLYYWRRERKVGKKWFIGALVPLGLLGFYLAITGSLEQYTRNVGWFYPLDYPGQMATKMPEWLWLTAMMIWVMVAVNRATEWLRWSLIMIMPALLYRPYHHYWLQILPLLLVPLIDHDGSIIKPAP